MSDDYPSVLERAELLHDRASIDAALDRLGSEIGAALAGTRPVYVTILTGALVVAGMLAPRIPLDLDFDYVHVTRFHGGTEGGELAWRAGPRHELRGRTVLLVDDILDEGHTLEALRRHALEQGAERVLIAVLVQKLHDRALPGLKADFVGLTVPDRYVFGFGMDYQEHGRNLYGIYAT